MHDCLTNLIEIEKKIQLKINKKPNLLTTPKIIAVSKTFPMKEILPLINHGHIHFGENKVQETIEKWSSIKFDFTHLQLHLVGKLQTNKVKYAVQIFDYIHSLDSLKLAEKISIEQKKFKRNIKIFIQINIGNEEQKNGIPISGAQEFYKKCINDFGLNIIGFMCLPPNTDNNSLYFSKMEKLISESKIKELSMGMSGDYMEALDFQSTFLRIGSSIFGKRV
jgi:pyridoxal phosphate enzyme (YggS family)|tara:strand:- start:2603 stop:3268 length:666 start_codon:yes stop_codon:yes gene_type:complete